MTETLEHLNDRTQIRALIDAYANCADRRDAAGQMALFTENSQFLVFYDVRSAEPSARYQGRAALAPVFDALNAYEATMHFNGQNSVVLDGDRATGEAYCFAHHITRSDAGRQLMVAAIRYLDSFTRTAAGWLFSERRLMVDWIENRPFAPPQPAA